MAEKSRMAKGNPIDAPLLKAMVDSIGEGILVFRPDYTITFANETIARLMKMDRAEFFGKTCYRLFHARQSPCDDCPVKETWDKGEPSFTMHRGRNTSGEETHVALNTYPIVDPRGKVTRVVMTVRDIRPLLEMEDKLRRSESKYRMLLEKMNDGFAIIDSNGKLTMVNKKFCEMLGYDADELRGKNVAMLLDVKNKKILEKELEKRRLGKSSVYELEFIAKSGSRLPTLISASPLFDDEGKYVGSYAVITDMTERKTLEQKLREYAEKLEAKVAERTKELKISEEKYRRLVESSPDAIFIVDRKSDKIIDINKTVCDLLGFSRDEIIGTIAGSRVASFHKAAYKREYEKHKKTGKFVGEFELRKKDGNTIPVEIRGSAYGDYLFAFARDITERRRADKELSALLNISRNISFALELDELLEVAVKKTVEATGVDRVSVVLVDEEGMGRVLAAYTKSGEKTGVGNVFHINDFTRMKEAIDKKKTVYVPDALDPKTQSPIEIALARKLNIGSGIHVPLIVRDRVVGLLNFAAIGKARKFTKRDIEFYETIANELSAMIAHAKLYEEMKQARNEAEFYIDLMAHDINNANTVAMGMLDLLAEAGPENKMNYIQRSRMALKRSINLIENVRKVQLVKLTGVSAFEKRNLDNVLRGVIKDVKDFYVDRVVKIKYTPKKAMICTDGLVYDLFWNLLDNAAKYDRHEEVKIDIEVKDIGEEWLVRIKDRGRGIPNGLKVAIFERFKRIDEGVRGSGIGLYLCKLLIDKYGGRIWVENRVKGDYRKGSIFNVVLPKA